MSGFWEGKIEAEIEGLRKDVEALQGACSQRGHGNFKGKIEANVGQLGDAIHSLKENIKGIYETSEEHGQALAVARQRLDSHSENGKKTDAEMSKVREDIATIRSEVTKIVAMGTIAMVVFGGGINLLVNLWSK